MKTSTKKILLTSKGELNKSVTNAIAHCRFDEDQRKIHTGYYSGKGRWATRASAYSIITSILKAQGYKYAIGNDAPKGGVLGEYVRVSKTAMNFIRSI